MNQDPRMSQDARMNHDRLNSDGSRLNHESGRMSQEIRLNPELRDARLNQDMARMNPDHLEMAHMSQIYPEDMEMTHIQDGRFNTLRGHFVPYR